MKEVETNIKKELIKISERYRKEQAELVTLQKKINVSSARQYANRQESQNIELKIAEVEFAIGRSEIEMKNIELADKKSIIKHKFLNCFY